MVYQRTVLNETGSTLEPLYEKAQEVIGEVKERLQPVDSWIREVARERPLMALAGAAGVGYLLGRLIRRL